MIPAVMRRLGTSHQEKNQQILGSFRNWKLTGCGGGRKFGKASGTGERDRLRRVTTPLEISPRKNRRWVIGEII